MTVIKTDWSKIIILPILNNNPIVGDEHADPEFGTGVVNHSHDQTNFLVGPTS